MVTAVLTRDWAGDLVELAKPRIVVMVMITAGAGFWLAGPGAAQLFTLFHLFVGTALVAAGTNALNHIHERDTDALMRRTRSRPLPAGRLALPQAVAFAWGTGIAGITYLTFSVNTWTGALGLATLVSYVFLYTPLKRRSSLSTLVGAVPGALPILGGWAAAQGAPTTNGWVLFWIVFLWQLPHFLALAWIHRDDYARAGMPMVSVSDATGRLTFAYAALYAAALIPVSLAPTALRIAGSVYFGAALVLSGGFFAAALNAAMRPSTAAARTLFKASLIYLPILLLLMSADRIT